MLPLRRSSLKRGLRPERMLPVGRTGEILVFVPSDRSSAFGHILEAVRSRLAWQMELELCPRTANT